MRVRLAIAALLLLLLAVAGVVAQQPAPTVLIIEEVAQSGSLPQNLELQRLVLLATLRIRGVGYRYVTHRSVTTAGASAGQFTTSQGVEQFKLVIHLWYDTESSPANAAVYDPRTYQRSATWPSVPHLWYYSPSGTSYNNTSTDTTGTNDFYGNGQALAGSLYAVGRPWTWKNFYGSPKPAVATSPRAAGYWRALVAYGVTAASVGNVNSSGIRPFVVNADSLLNRSDNPDSVCAWTRAKSGSPADLARSQIHVAANGGIQDISTLLCALGYADSVSSINTPGGGVFTSRTQTTREYSMFFTAANRRGHPNEMNQTRGGGIYVPAGGDTSDLPYFSQGVDSMNTLLDLDGNPIPFTWCVDTDSLNGAWPAQVMPILKKAKAASFAIQNVNGAVSGANTATAASTPTSSPDPAGNVRARTLFPTVASLTPQCASDTGAIQCRINAAFANLEAAVPGRVDHALIAEEFDVLPQSWTIAGAGAAVSGNLLGGEDSLRAALWSAGVRAVVFSPTYDGHNVGLGWASTSGNLPYNTNPSTISPSERMWNVRWGGRVVGRIAHIGSRWEPEQVQWRWVTVGHQGAEEWRAGAELGKYYLVDAAPYYHHTFSVSTRAIGMQAAGLGGPRGTPWPQRQAWWVMKWAVHGFLAAESFLPRWANGERKRLVRWVRLEKLAV